MKSYREDPSSTFTHRGKTYSVNKTLQVAEHLTTKSLLVNILKWVLEYDTPDPQRQKKADLTAPILVVFEPEFGREAYTVVDGLHRLARALDKGRTTIPVKLLRIDDLPTPEKK